MARTLSVLRSCAEVSAMEDRQTALCLELVLRTEGRAVSDHALEDRRIID